MSEMDEKQVEDLLQRTRREPPESHLHALPARVLRAAERRPGQGWLQWSLAAAGALALIVAIQPGIRPEETAAVAQAGRGENAPIPVANAKAEAEADPGAEDLRALAEAADRMLAMGPSDNDVDPTIFDLNATELAQLERLLTQGG
jgi:hypothetical protein